MERAGQRHLGIAPDGRRTGLFQVVHGWLGPHQGWPAGETDADP